MRRFIKWGFVIIVLLYAMFIAKIACGNNLHVMQKDLDIFSRVIDGEAGICSRKAKINVCAFILNHKEFHNRIPYFERQLIDSQALLIQLYCLRAIFAHL